MPSAESGFELRDHTADIALYVWGNTLPALFSSAAAGLYATIGLLKVGGACHDATLGLEAGDAESLLHDFLSELHFRFETRDEMYSEFDFGHLDGHALEVKMRMGRIDRDASVFDREVKAVTYHDLEITQSDGRYEVTLVLDI